MKLLGIIAISLTAALLQIHLLQMACGSLPNNMGLWITQGWPGYRSRILGLWLIKLFGGAALKITRALPALGLTFLALLGATLVFGIVDEMRVWISFVPLLILAVR